LERILNDCNDNNNVNCVLIWAQGSYFTAGLDLAYAVENFKDGKSPFLKLIRSLNVGKKFFLFLIQLRNLLLLL